MKMINPAKTYSLSKKLTLSLAISLILIGGGALSLYSYLSTYRATLDLKTKTQETLTSLSGTLALPLWDVDEPTIKAICNAYAKNDLIGSIKVKRIDGYTYFDLVKTDSEIMEEKSIPISHNGENMGTLTLALTADSFQKLNRRFFLFYTFSLAFLILALSLVIKKLLRIYLRQPLDQFVKMVESFASGDEDAFKKQALCVEFEPFIRVMKQMGSEINQQIKSLEFIQYAVDHNVISTYWIDKNGRIIYTNEAACRTSGYTQTELLSFSIKDLISDAPDYKKQSEIHSMDTIDPAFIETFQHRKDGSTFPVEVTANYLKYNQENYIFAFVKDISENKQAEEQIKASLREKEVLLKEVHHRVKNNMQVITSLLMLQSDQIEDKLYADMFRESRDRIKSMALVHEIIYGKKSFAKVDFKDYVKNLVDSLFRSYGVAKDRIALKIDIENVTLAVESAIPCGLIVNELVSNSLKYAFPGNRAGEISVAIHSINSDELVLEISDNGIGIPEELDIRNTGTVGLHLVTLLSEEQLEGEIELNRESGTIFHIKFERRIYKNRL